MEVAAQLLLGSPTCSLQASLQSDGPSAQEPDCMRRPAITQAAAWLGAIHCTQSAPQVEASQTPDACRWTCPACSVPSLWPAAWVLQSACPTATKVGAQACLLPRFHLCCCRAVQGCANQQGLLPT